MKIAIASCNIRHAHLKKPEYIEFLRKRQEREALIRKQLGGVYMPHNATHIIDIGGDGGFVDTIKANAHFDIPFYGINMGTLGALLNNHAPEDSVEQMLREAVWIEFPLLEVTVEFADGTTEEVLAFNDVWTKTEAAVDELLKTIDVQTAKHRVLVNGKNIMPQVIPDRETFAMGDAVVVCSAGGSTAYYSSAGGKAFSPQNKLIGIAIASPSPIPFKPIRVPDDSEVIVEMIDDEKRRHLVIADNLGFRNVRRAVIRKSTLSVTIGFKPGETHAEKIRALRKKYKAILQARKP